MTALHATEAYSVHLALAARVEGLTPAAVEDALFVDRTLVKQLAMRRTLFALLPEMLPAAWGSASARTAVNELKALKKAAVASGITAEPDAWWDDVSGAALGCIAERGAVAATGFGSLHPVLEGRLRVGSGNWTSEVPLGPKVLLVLGVQGLIVRVGNTAHWRLARPTWGLTTQALPEVGAPLSSAEGYATLLRSWLWTFGPGTETDMTWWLGSTKTAVRAALAEIGAVQVSLDSGDVGWVLPDDVPDDAELAEAEGMGDWAALLPVLDPTVMGWKQREFHLDPDDVAYLFDSNGNAGTTAWWNGRVVGCWVQDEDGTVRVVLRPHHRESVGVAGVNALEAEAERLTAFLAGTVIASVYSSRQMKGERLP